ncbi:hypothetical protein [Wolbachia endosymbiont of Mansonella ozzardi]|uniref:hypothetical protein n=1 Tax=Wolbachia endosymbiont of Mansonella ozzardi TaxID=137464 RepID=UPI001CE1C0F1|nr:hypothetical protein [Wolbachia endosymbiont of Mansonella ozzardi]
MKPGTSGAKSTLDYDVKDNLPERVAKQENINIGSGLFATHGIGAGLIFYFVSKS